LTILVQRGAMGVSIDVLWGFACIAHTRVFFYSRRGVACPRARARVCVCVCDSHDRGPAKAAEPIEMPFGSRLPCMLRGVQITHGKGYFRGGACADPLLIEKFREVRRMWNEDEGIPLQRSVRRRRCNPSLTLL